MQVDDAKCKDLVQVIIIMSLWKLFTYMDFIHCKIPPLMMLQTWSLVAGWLIAALVQVVGCDIENTTYLCMCHYFNFVISIWHSPVVKCLFPLWTLGVSFSHSVQILCLQLHTSEGQLLIFLMKFPAFIY